jgi:hypothetical protein
MSFTPQECLVSSVGMGLLFFSTVARMYLVAHPVGCWFQVPECVKPGAGINR